MGEKEEDKGLKRKKKRKWKGLKRKKKKKDNEKEG